MDTKKGNMMIIAGAIFGIIVLFGLWIFLTYNSIVGLKLETDNAWAKVQAVYQERFDLIPRIVASVNAQTQQEKDLLKHIADARTRYINGQTDDEKVAAANDLDNSIRAVFPVVLQENYPNVQFAQAFSDFRTVYEGQENRVRVERNRYNDAATEFNKAISFVPGNIVAGMFGFKPRELFKANAGAENAPDVNFNMS